MPKHEITDEYKPVGILPVSFSASDVGLAVLTIGLLVGAHVIETPLGVGFLVGDDVGEIVGLTVGDIVGLSVPVSTNGISPMLHSLKVAFLIETELLR